jgi:hypothetical protein
MLTAVQTAAVVAAIAFAVLAAAGVYALVKLARLISDAAVAAAICCSGGRTLPWTAHTSSSRGQTPSPRTWTRSAPTSPS